MVTSLFAISVTILLTFITLSIVEKVSAFRKKKKNKFVSNREQINPTFVAVGKQ
ncbi:hypothetical protein [Aquibacillus sediminis]|uniref:hypothetical protein n=1 Tax=Aquibacillus sediminis TaxID=2574734 RepID=UPI001486BCDA|nr:hypothetical protein [Aquibacillus sediminis]